MGIGPIWGIRSLNLSSLGLSEQIERPMPIPIFLNSLARFGNNPHLQLRMQLYEENRLYACAITYSVQDLKQKYRS